MSTPSMDQVSRAAVDSGYWEHDEVARALAAHDAQVRADERAKRPDREQVAQIIADHEEYPHPRGYVAHADAILAALALEPEAREVADAEVEAARAVITALAPYNMELRPDGREDREAAAYVSGVMAASDAIPEALRAARDVSRG